MTKGSVDRDLWTVLFAVEQEVERGASLHGAGFDRPNLPAWMVGHYDHATFGVPTAESVRLQCDTSFSDGYPNWAEILIEEVCEALEETGDDDRLRTELIQVAAVCCAWARVIDSRRAGTQQPPNPRAERSDDNRT